MQKTVLLASSCLLLFAVQANAQVTVFGPTPYRSAADSPFAKYLGGPNFYLEDFEEGELNTPGISQAPTSQGVIMPPGPLTDSVDLDDGVQDGNGNDGYAMVASNLSQGLSDPIVNGMSTNFFFSTTQGMPNAFGFVLTDSPLNSNTVDGVSFRLAVYDATDNLIGRTDFFPTPLSTSRSGESQNDLFLGLKSNADIARVSIGLVFQGNSLPANDSFDFEIDHVQYGVVPEPSGGALLLSGLAIGIAALRGWHRQS